MKRVGKSPAEPQALAGYKTRFANAPRPPVWKDFKKTPGKSQVQEQLRQDQRGLCAYCENRLVPQDESVEHFIARDADHAKELEWGNLLLCCAGGERPLPEDVEAGETRYDPQGPRTCGHAKLNSREIILNPLILPHTPRLFRFKSQTGEIVHDPIECGRAGVDAELAKATIRVLALDATRLNRARLSLMTQLGEELDEAGETSPLSLDRERELAAVYFSATGAWPAFFTTIRFCLGDGAEDHLRSIGFQG